MNNYQTLPDSFITVDALGVITGSTKGIWITGALNADVQTGNNGTRGIYSATLKYKF